MLCSCVPYTSNFINRFQQHYFSVETLELYQIRSWHYSAGNNQLYQVFGCVQIWTWILVPKKNVCRHNTTININVRFITMEWCNGHVVLVFSLLFLFMFHKQAAPIDELLCWIWLLLVKWDEHTLVDHPHSWATLVPPFKVESWQKWHGVIGYLWLPVSDS